MKRMRALVCTGDGAGAVELVPVPEPGPGTIRVRVEGSGVCASDLPVWEGRPWFEYPREPGSPGHEGWGTVDAVGPGVRGFTEGDRVAMLSYHAYAEYDLADASAAVRLPDSLAGKPFPAEPLACAVNVMNRSGIAPGETVAVVGTGFLGLLLVRLAASRGARVIALSRRPSALEAAKRLGADETVLMDDDRAAIDRVTASVGEAGCDCVIEAAGKQQPLDLASELVRIRGRLVIAGYHQDGPRQVKMQLWNWRGLDVINAHERDPAVYAAGMREAVRLAESGALEPWPLFTHVYTLESFAGAAGAMRSRPEGFLKAVVRI